MARLKHAKFINDVAVSRLIASPAHTCAHSVNKPCAHATPRATPRLSSVRARKYTCPPSFARYCPLRSPLFVVTHHHLPHVFLPCCFTPLVPLLAPSAHTNSICPCVLLARPPCLLRLQYERLLAVKVKSGPQKLGERVGALLDRRQREIDPGNHGVCKDPKELERFFDYVNSDNLHRLDRLLAPGFPFIDTVRGQGEKGAVQMSVAHGHLDILRCLLDGGANPNIQDFYGQVPLSYAWDLWDAARGEEGSLAIGGGGAGGGAGGPILPSSPMP